MSNFDLPIVSADASPDFTDANTCATWLQELPLINVAPSHGRLLGQLEELNCFDTPASERLKILEMLREPVQFLQGEHTRKFAPRPVPLAKNERDVFTSVVALWDALSHGYQHCLKAIVEGGEISGQAALVCQRVLWCVAQRYTENYKACMQPTADDWRLLHKVYAIAEERDVADDEVPHPLNKGAETTCSETYAHVLLLHLANPNEYPPRQLAYVSRWLDRWARKVLVQLRPPASEYNLPPLAVNLESGAGAAHNPVEPGASTRYLNLDGVAKSVRKRVSMLRKGEAPEALGLGEGLTAASAEQLLVLLYRQWCEDKKSRAAPRKPSSSHAQLTTGIAAMHYFISGEAFMQPNQSRQLSKAERDEIATFGRVSVARADSYGESQGFSLEQWNVLDESLGGMRIERPADGGNGRLLHNQLVAVRPSDASGFTLATVRWLEVSHDFELRTGLRLLPGAPKAIAIRPFGLNAMNEKYVPALSLPELPALKVPATLVIPAGWYKPKRVIEAYSDRAEELMLTGVVERGGDFERVTYGAA